MCKETETSNSDCNYMKKEKKRVRSAKIITEMIEGRMYYEIEWITMDGEEKTGYFSFNKNFVDDCITNEFEIISED